ncbi:MAG TPA: hypothetical protein VLB04_02680, partial [Methanotrichaceae archaeon]|nr:hypothetical protein [Methanotrichaceae archaeon]
IEPSQTKNLSFRSIFKNGDTWHESEAYTMTSLGIASSSNSGGTPANAESSANGTGTAQAGMTTVAAAILLTGMIGGIVLWHKKKNKPKA